MAKTAPEKSNEPTNARCGEPIACGEPDASLSLPNVQDDAAPSEARQRYFAKQSTEKIRASFAKFFRINSASEKLSEDNMLELVKLLATAAFEARFFGNSKLVTDEKHWADALERLNVALVRQNLVLTIESRRENDGYRVTEIMLHNVVKKSTNYENSSEIETLLARTRFGASLKRLPKIPMHNVLRSHRIVSPKPGRGRPTDMARTAHLPGQRIMLLFSPSEMETIARRTSLNLDDLKHVGFLEEVSKYTFDLLTNARRTAENSEITIKLNGRELGFNPSTDEIKQAFSDWALLSLSKDFPLELRAILAARENEHRLSFSLAGLGLQTLDESDKRLLRDDKQKTTITFIVSALRSNKGLRQRVKRSCAQSYQKALEQAVEQQTK